MRRRKAGNRGFARVSADRISLGEASRQGTTLVVLTVADLKGHGFSRAVTGSQMNCHHEGALAPEGSAFPGGAA